MLRFAQASSSVDTSFWRVLADKKLHEWKLDAAPKRIVGWMTAGRTGPVLEVNGGSFTDGAADVARLGQVGGVLLLCNTVEQFKACDKDAFLASCRDHAFCLLVFADLKQHQFVYWFGFPCLVAASTGGDGSAGTPAAVAAAAAPTTVTDVFMPAAPLEVHSHTVEVSERLLSAMHAFVGNTVAPEADTVAAAAAAAGTAATASGGACSASSAGASASTAADAFAAEVAGFRALPPLPSPLSTVAALLDFGFAPGGKAEYVADKAAPWLQSLQQYEAGLLAALAANGRAAVGGSTFAHPAFVLFEPLPASPVPQLPSIDHVTAAGSGSDAASSDAGAAVLSWFTRAAMAHLCLRYGQLLAALQSRDSSSVSDARLSFLIVRGTAAMLKQLEEGRRLGVPDADIVEAVRTSLSHYSSCGMPLATRISGTFRPSATQEQAAALLSLSAPTTTSAAGATSGATPVSAPFAVIGWEPNARGQLAPRMANLRAAMDPAALAESSAALNLSLMRWRQLPELDLARIASQRVLLLGCGTLGCAVARDLLAWGVRTMTLVDSGRVQFSNPVRQPLFELDDCTAEPGGRLKAVAAARALERIHPRVKVTPLTLTIPMPGHPLPATAVPAALADAHALNRLIADHDVVFLLTDTRESRWLPTLLAAHHRKLALTVALGFDTFLVLRHGIPKEPAATGGTAATGGAASAATGAASSSADAAAGAAAVANAGAAGTASTAAPLQAIADASRLGCYFCTDVVAPGDSTANRTLDQQCTVTRPGGAPISSAFAVELLVSLLHHPQRFHAPADGPTPLLTPGASPLGLVPHQLRGYLTHFFPLLTASPAYDACTACSETVLRAFAEEGDAFLVRAFQDPSYLERLTGLADLHASTAGMELQWMEDGEDDDEVDEGDDADGGGAARGSSDGSAGGAAASSGGDDAADA